MYHSSIKFVYSTLQDQSPAPKCFVSPSAPNLSLKGPFFPTFLLSFRLVKISLFLSRRLFFYEFKKMCTNLPNLTSCRLFIKIVLRVIRCTGLLLTIGKDHNLKKNSNPILLQQVWKFSFIRPQCNLRQFSNLFTIYNKWTFEHFAPFLSMQNSILFLICLRDRN